MEHYDRESPEVAGGGPYAREREQLVPMSTLESSSVSDGDPDIRGWDVRTVSGRQLGVVRDLLVDPRGGEVVLLDVDLPGSDRHTFVPIRVVQIERARRLVMMDSADLPSANVARTRADAAPRRLADVETVRFPRTERQLAQEHAQLADGGLTAADLADRERRRSERRRIDRMSSEF